MPILCSDRGASLPKTKAFFCPDLGGGRLPPSPPRPPFRLSHRGAWGQEDGEGMVEDEAPGQPEEEEEKDDGGKEDDRPNRKDRDTNTTRPRGAPLARWGCTDQKPFPNGRDHRTQPWLKSLCLSGITRPLFIHEAGSCELPPPCAG